ncbi:FecR domain-containing protein [Methylophaga sp.]|uniref:FecR domain-containing protein n=1 Tax=Methylophaga sp. TaxID=2024840 RepID=UPI003A8DE902
MSKPNTIEPYILDQAADWLMRLSATDVTESDRAACLRWQQLHPDHARAWAKAELLINKLGSLPPSLAIPALDRPENPNRRAIVNKLAILLAIAPIGWGSWRTLETLGWTADYHTASGERRELQLADGTQLTLNTATSIDVQFDDEKRFIWLRSGEILVQTAVDNALVSRPFMVGTRQGQLEALGTKFTVYQQANSTQLAVLEGTVKVTPKDADISQQKVVKAGQQIHFNQYAVESSFAVNQAATAWTQGMLMADKMPLVEFVGELARYRSGIVRCDPKIADLPVSGSFPVSDTDLTLRMLVSTYPIQLTSHMQGYWINLLPI